MIGSNLSEPSQLKKYLRAMYKVLPNPFCVSIFWNFYRSNVFSSWMGIRRNLL